MNLTNQFWHRKGEAAYQRLEQASNNSPRIGWNEKNHNAVALLQEALVTAGFSIPHENGFSGNYLGQTTAAVQRLQHDWGIGGQPGIAGHDVLCALDDWLCSNAFATPPAATSTPDLTTVFVVDGFRYRIEPGNLDEQLGMMIQGVYNRIRVAITNRLSFMRQVAGYRAPQNQFIRMVSEGLGGATMPPESILHEGMSACARAWRALSHFDQPLAIQEIGNALVFYHVFKSQWEDYITGTNVGAERAITGLDWTSTILLSTAAAYFTGGASAEVQIAGSALRTFLTRAGIGAAVNVQIATVREFSVQATESFLNVDPEWNWRLMATNITASGVSGFVSSLTGGWVRNYLAQYSMVVSEAELVAMNRASARIGMSALTREQLQNMWPRIVTRVLAAVPQAAVIDAARTAVSQIGTTGSLNGFLKKWWENLPQDIVRTAIAQAISGGVVRPNDLGNELRDMGVVPRR